MYADQGPLISKAMNMAGTTPMPFEPRALSLGGPKVIIPCLYDPYYLLQD